MISIGRRARRSFCFSLFICAALLHGFSSSVCLAQNGAEALELSRISSNIIIDGKLDEAAWQSLAPLPIVMYQPTFKGDMTEKTELFVAYDNDALYIGGRCYDSQPDQIRANSLYRDRYSSDDIINIVIDTYDDNENAKWFMVLPSGVRVDALISGDAEGFWLNESWNAFWDAEASRSEQGWSAEVRIPFSTLGFQSVANIVTMGLIVNRWIARNNERHIFPAIEPNWDWGQFKPSQAHTVIMREVQSRNPLYVTPYVRGGRERIAQRPALLAPFETVSENDRELGIDIKYKLTSNLDLDLTANTDFAQVEADEQQVNLTRFSLFFPEKRQFFQERSSIFDFNTGLLSRLFYSRRIGLTSLGQPLRIYGGLRLVGRIGGWDLGLLDMQTGEMGEFKSENYGVLRLRRQVLNPYSYTGTMLTNRVDTDGRANTAIGVDGSLRVTGDEYFYWQAAGTRDSGQSVQIPDALRIRAGWARRRGTGLSYDFSTIYAGSDFNPGMGFVQRHDFTQFSGGMYYGHLSGETSRVRLHTSGAGYSLIYRNSDHHLDSGLLILPWSVQFKSGATFFLGGQLQYEDISFDFSLSPNGGSFIPQGSFLFGRSDVSFRTSQSRLLQYQIGGSYGQFYDGIRSSVNGWINWFASRHLELRAEYSADRIRFADRNQEFNTNLYRLRLRTAANRKLSVNIFLQYSDALNRVSINSRLRYNFREGNDLWLVFNQNRNTDRLESVIKLPLINDELILFKYTYTLIR